MIRSLVSDGERGAVGDEGLFWSSVLLGLDVAP